MLQPLVTVKSLPNTVVVVVADSDGGGKGEESEPAVC